MVSVVESISDGVGGASYIVLVAVALVEACVSASQNHVEEVPMAIKLTSLVSGHINACSAG